MKRPEEALQRAVVAYLHAALPPPWFCFCVPNGGGRSKAEAGALKAQGVTPGIPDLIVMGLDEWRDTYLIGLELKAPPATLRSGAVSKAKPRVSKEQTEMHARFEACGAPVRVVRSVEDVERELRALGVPLKARTGRAA